MTPQVTSSPEIDAHPYYKAEHKECVRESSKSHKRSCHKEQGDQQFKRRKDQSEQTAKRERQYAIFNDSEHKVFGVTHFRHSTRQKHAAQPYCQEDTNDQHLFCSILRLRNGA